MQGGKYSFQNTPEILMTLIKQRWGAIKQHETPFQKRGRKQFKAEQKGGIRRIAHRGATPLINNPSLPGESCTQKPFIAGSLHQRASQPAASSTATASMTPPSQEKVCTVSCVFFQEPLPQLVQWLQGSPRTWGASWRSGRLVEALAAWRMRFHGTLEMEISP